jgi:hypothetical protein
MWVQQFVGATGITLQIGSLAVRKSSKPPWEGRAYAPRLISALPR